MARDFESPAYYQIANDLAERIDDGELTDGYQLSTRQELAEANGVSLQVVRDALAVLHTQGYLRSTPSKGTYVQRPKPLELPILDFEADDRERDAFVAVVQDQDHVPGQDLTVETVISGERGVPPELGLPKGAPVTVRRRVRLVNDVPYAISDSYYPYDLVSGTALTSPADIDRGARHVLRELGLGMDHHYDKIRSRRPRAAEVQRLRIAPGMSVIAHTRSSFTAGGQLIRVLVSVLPSDRWILTYKVE